MLNSVNIIGTVGKDLETQAVGESRKVVIRLCVPETKYNKHTHQKTTKFHWFECHAWGKIAELAEKFLSKKSKIGITGSLEYQEWKTKTGAMATKVLINIDKFEMLASGLQQTRSDADEEDHGFNPEE